MCVVLRIIDFPNNVLFPLCMQNLFCQLIPAVLLVYFIRKMLLRIIGHTTNTYKRIRRGVPTKLDAVNSFLFLFFLCMLLYFFSLYFLFIFTNNTLASEF